MDQSESYVIPADKLADRADRILADCLPGGRSRSSITRLIRLGRVLVEDRPIRPSTVLNPGDRVLILHPGMSDSKPLLEEIPQFRILWEDSELIVVDKPAGLVVHPGAGRLSGTLVDALISSRPEMIGVGEPNRWGIVHRLDRDTSGVMVTAKTVRAHAGLSAQFREHSVHRIYLALVRGNPGADRGVVDAPLGRHAKERKRMSTSAAKCRSAVTRWAVRQRFGPAALLEVAPQTGRTHQIRVHLASVGLPVLGDPVYGRIRRKSSLKDPMLRRVADLLTRQALHAAVLGFVHPGDANYAEFSAPLPKDMAAAIDILSSGTNSA